MVKAAESLVLREKMLMQKRYKYSKTIWRSHYRITGGSQPQSAGSLYSVGLLPSIITGRIADEALLDKDTVLLICLLLLAFGDAGRVLGDIRANLLWSPPKGAPKRSDKKAAETWTSRS